MFIIMGLLIVLVVSFVAIVPVLAVGGTSLPGDYSIGSLPDSQVYFVTSIKRTITGYFTFGVQNEAKLALKYANEDILAINRLCEEEKYQVAEKHCQEFLGHFEDATKLTVKTRFSKGERYAAVLIEAMKQSNIWQRNIIAEILEQTPATMQESFLETIDNSSSRLGTVIGTIYGADNEELFLQSLEPLPELSSYQTPQDTAEIPVDNSTEQLPDENPIDGAVIENPSVITDTTQPLIISSMEAEDDRVSPNDECRIECNVASTDDDSLNYEWSASGGEISGKGASITWIAPQEADKYEITVTVSNEQGEEASDSIKIKVISVDPPEIEEVVVDPHDPQFLIVQPFSKKYVILNRQSCDLECVVENEGDYDYEWFASDGEISGSGSTVTWTAPGSKKIVTVTVRVSDGNGNEVEQEVTFDVRTCRPCFL